MKGFVAAAEAGIAAVPVDTTTKRAMIRWGQYQEQIPELLILQEWDQADHNIAVICGQVSGRLIALDFETGFMEHLPTFAKRLDQAGVHEVFESWVAGYSESTPSGGLHVLVRVEGDGPLEGNAKLATDPGGKVLVETRAEGGYVIVAPSRNGKNGWERLTGGFDSIAYATREEWDLVVAVLTSFDASTPPPTVHESPAAPRVPSILRLGSSWIDDELARLPDIRTVLSSMGWEPANSRDQYGEHWVRPGKPAREGHSASISAAGRIYVHSSNAGLPMGNPTLDALDVILARELQRRPTQEERVAFLREQRPPAELGGVVAPPTAVEVAELNLPLSFWESRPYLAHIRQAALARRLSPDAVWEAVKCFYAAAIPWNHRLPGDGTMDYISIIVGPSGAGKSRAKQEAYNLLEGLHQIAGIRFPAPVGSGEGMTAAYLSKSDDGPKYQLRGIGWYADEAKFVLDISSRPGNTTMQAIKQGWSGELTGSVAATAERHRWLDPRDVRFTLLMSVTPGVAARFLSSDLSDEGLPQRVSWGWAIYDHQKDKPEHPGPLEIPVHDHNRAKNVYVLDLDSDLEDLVDERQFALARGEGEGLEGHSTYATLKTAALHAHLAGRMRVTMEDWDLGASDWQQTVNIRKHLSMGADQAVQERNHAAGVARAHSRIAEDDIYLERAAHSLVNKVQKSKDPLTLREIKDHLRPFKQRHGIDHREVLELVISRGLVHSEGGIVSAH